MAWGIFYPQTNMYAPIWNAGAYSLLDIGQYLATRWVLNQQSLALQRLDVLRRLQVLAEHSRARHNMVRQNANQLVLVFGLQQTLECCLGELGKRRIGRGENGEGALALQRSNQTARFERSHERRQVTAALSELDNVFIGLRGSNIGRKGDQASEKSEDGNEGLHRSGFQK